eukprot:CAMPEP_0181277160 /NCGR_PEP_ID=MMETSP1097-20121128/10931_1 /TAXON_ID=35684 /ORGANISM="Pseudopedinella elastica, Strain CCMP716" /LENGTH=87 /DNA_ID=CAMNT_0023378927 /DNA_START=8 /DNA_END=268 /DNA_ORIENTATION=+
MSSSGPRFRSSFTSDSTAGGSGGSSEADEAAMEPWPCALRAALECSASISLARSSDQLATLAVRKRATGSREGKISVNTKSRGKTRY